jgi:uncharacterized glyoxalase superfamily protein PhnB
LIKENRYVLAVQDLARSAEYYKTVLGFAVHEIGDPGWRFFIRDGVTIMAGECSDDLPALETGSHSYFAYLLVENIDALFEEFTSRGVDFIKPLRDEVWGMREFGLQTIDGHRMMYGQEISKKD